MNQSISQALNGRGLIDISTTGRRTGLPRRIEIAIHTIGGRHYISGMPSHRKRSWIANLEANPHLTIHVKDPAAPIDLPATARVIDDEGERRTILERIARVWRRTDVDQMVAYSPLIEVSLQDVPAPLEPVTAT